MTTLKDVYERYRQSGKALKVDGFSASMLPPALPRDAAGWADANHRLLIIGQEPRGRAWNESKVGGGLESLADFFQSEDAVDRLMAGFPSFIDQVVCRPPGPFWKYLSSIQEIVGEMDATAVSYTNLIKCATLQEPKCHLWTVSENVRNEYLAWQAGLLHLELSLLKPTLVLFLTGPYYDPFLRSEFPYLTFEAMPNYTERQAARLAQTELSMPAFRTYHPGYLNRSFRLTPIVAALEAGRFC